MSVIFSVNRLGYAVDERIATACRSFKLHKFDENTQNIMIAAIAPKCYITQVQQQLFPRKFQGHAINSKIITCAASSPMVAFVVN